MRAEFTSMMENGKREIFVKIFDKVGKDEQVVLVLSTGYLDRDQATEERAAQFVIETMERRLHEVTRLFKEQGLL